VVPCGFIIIYIKLRKTEFFNTDFARCSRHWLDRRGQGKNPNIFQLLPSISFALQPHSFTECFCSFGASTNPMYTSR
jgi:hypothetical protein